MIKVKANIRSVSLERFLNKDFKEFIKVFVNNLSNLRAQRVNNNILKPLGIYKDCRDIVIKCINYSEFIYNGTEYVLTIKDPIPYNKDYTYKQLFKIIDNGNLNNKALDISVRVNKYIDSNLLKLYSVFKEKER